MEQAVSACYISALCPKKLIHLVLNFSKWNKQTDDFEPSAIGFFASLSEFTNLKSLALDLS